METEKVGLSERRSHGGEELDRDWEERRSAD